MDAAKKKAQLERLISEGEKVVATKEKSRSPGLTPRVDASLFSQWGPNVTAAFLAIFGEGNHYVQQAHGLTRSNWSATDAERLLAVVKSALDTVTHELDVTESASEVVAMTPLDVVEMVCSRFGRVVRQLRERHGGRPGFEVENEYDVQDLLHALLCVFFDDVRAEEHAPSYAGAASRIDFLLKQEQLGLETKMTRKGLAGKEVGEELLVDIGRFQSHPDCKALVCFVYDPKGYIKNPHGLEKDLSKRHSELDVRVLVYPKA